MFQQIIPNFGIKIERERESKRLRRFVKLFFSFLFFTAIFLTVHSSVYAATYYVRKDGSATKANATGPSTDATKCMSMATHNAATFSPGDIILLSDKGGDFTSGLTPPSNGSSGNVITYSNATGETPTISGTVATIVTNTRSYLTIENIVINSQTTNDFAVAINIGSADNLLFSNMTITMPSKGYLVASSATATNITVDGLTGNGALKQAIYFYGTSNQNISIKNTTVTGGDSIRLRNIAGITIQNVTHHSSTANARLWIDNASSGVLHLDNYVTDLAGGSGLYIDGSNFDAGSYIQNSTISNVTQAFYLNNSSGILLQGNLAHNSSYGYFVAGSSHDISFLSNTATSNTVDGFQIGGTAYNIILTSNTANLNGAAKAFRILSNAHDITFASNVAEDNLGAGFWEQDNVYNVTHTSDIARNNTGDGFGTDNAVHDVTYFRCSAHGNGNKTNTFDGDGFTTHSTTYNIIINYCISYGNTASGYAMVGTSAGHIYNSIAYNNAGNWTSVGGVDQIRGGLYFSLSGNNPTTGTSWNVKNYIGMQNYPREILQTRALESIDYNVYYPTNNNQFASVDGGSTNISWSTYSSTRESHSLNSNPLFINIGTSDFQLQRLSPAIDTGTNLSLTTDYIGTTVPQGSGYDIGAYEYIPLTVTINQASGQSDPTSTSPVNFTVVFSESVSDFAAGDVTLSGTAGATTATVTGSGTTYNVAVTGMTGPGTVIATLAADIATGATSNTNAASTSADNTTTYDATAPSNPSLSSPTGYTNSNTRPTLVFKKASDSGTGIASYSVSLDSGKNRSFSTSGIPATGNGTSNYVWKDDSTVKVTFVNENDSDSGNDEIQVYFKGLDTTELSEGKHTWSVTTYDNVSNSTSTSVDFHIDKTSPSISELAIANVSTVTSGVSYNLDITNRMPSFSGLAIDPYQGSTVTNSNGTKDTFDKVSSGPQTLTLTLKKQNTDKTYTEHLTKDFSLSDIQDVSGDKKSTRFYVNTPFPLVDGYYQVAIVLKDGAGNSYTQSEFYLALNASKTTTLFTKNLETKITSQETIPAVTEEEREQVEQEGYIVKVKVFDAQNKPIAGAKVTIHSKVQETTTDENGMAEFKNVETGEHKIFIAYSGYSGEQKVNLVGDVKEFNFTIQVKQTNAFLNPQVLIVISIFVFVILTLIFLLIRAKTKK